MLHFSTYLKQAWLFVLCFCLPLALHANQPRPALLPAPLATANNECSGATVLTFNVPVSDNNVGATQSLPPNQCNGFASPNANDVWFSFTYTDQMDSLVVVPAFGPDNDMIVELFAGACGNLSLIGCSNFAEPNSDNQTEGIYLPAQGLIVGNTYKVRVYGYNGVESAFTIRLKTASSLPPPSNNDCSAAFLMNATVTIPGTTLGATQSLAPITCQGNTSTNANDVWYRFTKTAAMDTLALFPETAVDYVVDIRSNNCAAGTSVLCGDKPGAGTIEKIPLSGLTTGTVYLIRVYGKNGTAGDFSLRLKAPRANNNCAAATEILNSNPLTGSTMDASGSGPAACQGVADDDVWFKFSMTAGWDSIKVVPNGFLNPVLEIRSGTCANSTLVRCVNAGLSSITEKVFIGDLTPGTNYLVRVYSFEGTEGAQGSFTLNLIQGPIPGPENDNCTNPVQINDNSLITTNNLNATQTAPGVACGAGVSTSCLDVWFRFTKTASIDSLRVDGLGQMDMMVDVRANTCPNGTLVACLDVPGTEAKKLDLTHLTNGTTYLLRAYGRNGAVGDFTLQFIDFVVVVNPPANDECFDAVNLSLGTSCSSILGNNLAATETQVINANCSGGTQGTAKDVWYSFTANSTRAIVKLTNSTGFNGALEVFSGSCFGLTSIACANQTPASNDPDNPTFEELFLSGLQSGQTYYVRVYGNNGTEGSFAICAYNPNCNSGTPVLTLGQTSVLSNQAFTVSVAGANGTVRYEHSPNQSVWTSVDAVHGLTDTLVLTSTTTGIRYIRAVNRLNACYPVTSSTQQLTIRCGTPFVFPTGQDRITRVRFGSIDNSSANPPMGGNVQDFSSISATVCRGGTYPITLTTGNTSSSYNRMVWIDFTQDGDYVDAGENVWFGAYTAGQDLSQNIVIPNNAPLGTCKMRVALVNNNAAITSTDPCAAGPYLYGEIEEYSLTITTGTVANAGPNQTGCLSSATLAGNAPGTGNSGIWTVVSGSGTFANPSQANTTVSNLGAGENIFRWTVTNSCGISSDDVSITNSSPVANAGTDQIACSSSINLAASGTGSWSVLSGSASLASPNSATSAVNNLAPGLNQFIWTVPGSGPGCPAAKDTVSINRQLNPVSLGKDTLLCSNFVPAYTVAGPAGMSSYLWSTGAATASISIPSNSPDSVLILTVQTPQGCSFQDTVVVRWKVCVGIESQITGSDFQIVPNPSQGQAALWNMGSFDQPVRIRMFDVRGAVLMDVPSVLLQAGQPFVLPQGLSSGLYRLEVAGPGFRKHLNWAKQ